MNEALVRIPQSNTQVRKQVMCMNFGSTHQKVRPNLSIRYNTHNFLIKTNHITGTHDGINCVNRNHSYYYWSDLF